MLDDIVRWVLLSISNDLTSRLRNDPHTLSCVIGPFDFRRLIVGHHLDNASRGEGIQSGDISTDRLKPASLIVGSSPIDFTEGGYELVMARDRIDWDPHPCGSLDVTKLVAVLVLHHGIVSLKRTLDSSRIIPKQLSLDFIIVGSSHLRLLGSKHSINDLYMSLRSSISLRLVSLLG